MGVDKTFSSETLLLEIKNISIALEQNEIIKNANFIVNRGEFACLLGPSGCGKTTLLRAIAGFLKPYQGSVKINGEVVFDDRHFVEPEFRKVGLVFQSDTLFPHLTVEKNIGFGLTQFSAKQRKDRIGYMLELVGLSEYAHAYIHELSGGQKQRIAIARALAPGPSLLLLDEPFSNLDPTLRSRLADDIKYILEREGITALLVTHDQREAFVLSDKVGVMYDGSIVQWDSAYNLYHEPQDRFVANFVGQGIFIPGTLLAHDTVDTELGKVVGNRAYSWPPGTKVEVLLRPDDIIIDQQSPRHAKIVSRSFTGANIVYKLKLSSGQNILSILPSSTEYQLGDKVGINVSIEHLVLFKQ